MMTYIVECGAFLQVIVENDHIFYAFSYEYITM